MGNTGHGDAAGDGDSEAVHGQSDSYQRNSD